MVRENFNRGGARHRNPSTPIAINHNNFLETINERSLVPQVLLYCCVLVLIFSCGSVEKLDFFTNAFWLAVFPRVSPLVIVQWGNNSDHS